jgi:hypothetical protein
MIASGCVKLAGAPLFTQQQGGFGQQRKTTLGRADTRFRSSARNVLLISLALGAFVVLIVPLHSTFVADPRVLTDEQYVILACGWPLPFPLIPEPVCPYLLAGESPLTAFYCLVVVPLLLLAGGPRTMLAVVVLSLTLAVVQVFGAFFATFPSAFDLDFYPSPLQREAGCGLVLCGLDHTLFHLAQVLLLFSLAFFAYRAHRATAVERSRL